MSDSPDCSAWGAGRGPDSPRIVVVGNANVDVLMGDIAPWPTPGCEVVIDRYEWRVGGAAGNTGLALAAMGVREGVDSEVIAHVGEDFLGGWLEGAMAGAARLTRVPHPTALTVGLTHPDGQRTFVSYLGHLVTLPEERIDAALDSARPGDLLLLCGYFLLPELRAQAPGILRRARGRGMLTMIDTGWPDEGWTPAVRAEVAALLPYLSAFLPNRDELLGVTGGRVTDAADAAAAVLDMGAERVVVKCGPSGALMASAGEQATYPAPSVYVQDTVGAGDTFNAGLLAGLARGMSWADALAPAVSASALAIGSQPRRYPSWPEVAADATASSVTVSRHPLSVTK